MEQPVQEPLGLALLDVREGRRRAREGRQAGRDGGPLGTREAPPLSAWPAHRSPPSRINVR